MAKDDDIFTVQSDEPLELAGDVEDGSEGPAPLVDEESVFLGNEEPDFDLEDRVAELEKTIEDLRSSDKTSELRDSIPPIPQFDNPFFADVHTDGTWEEVLPPTASASTMTTGSPRSCTSSTDTSALLTPGTGQAMIVAIDTATGTKYIKVTAASTASGSFFPVICKQNGSDGSGYPLYNIYNQTDVTFTTALNSTTSALTPTCSRARFFLGAGMSIAAPSDGATGSAFYSSGVVQLFDLPETWTLCA